MNQLLFQGWEQAFARKTERYTRRKNWKSKEILFDIAQFRDEQS